MKRSPIPLVSIFIMLLVAFILLQNGKAFANGYATNHNGSVEARRLKPDSIVPPGSYMIPSLMPAWWHIGDTVNFRFFSDNMPVGLVILSGVVTDISGKEIVRIKTARADLQSKGWSWIPATPGYFEVTFSFINEQGKEELLSRPVTLRGSRIPSPVFPRDKQGFAVMPHSPGYKNVVGQFGFTYSNNPVELKLAKLMGFDLVRLLCDWGADFTNLRGGIESVKGQYNWGLFDKKVDLFVNAGFVLNAQFCYTPLWASPFPEKTDIKICVVEGTTYAPKDMNDFSRFVEKAVGRYKDHISLWEIWNEPSVPGGSIFWADTPENFVKLLEAGYKAVKKVQPASQVFLGGLGPRTPYYVFYNKILQLGAGKYFDVLSLHGAWNTPAEKFLAIQAENHVATKPAVSGEWHALLQGNMQSEPILPEPVLSMKMMKDLLYQIKQGISRTIIFEMINLAEKETLPFAIQNKVFTHSSGLFRRSPQIEPRHAAIVMANFLLVTGRKATYVKDFMLEENVVSIELATANGPVIVFWCDSATVNITSLKPFIDKKSVLLDWEGKNISIVPGKSLDTNKLYYLSGVNTSAIAKAEATNKLISPRSMAAVSAKAAGGSFYNGELFVSPQSLAKVPTSLWLENNWKTNTLPGFQHEEKFSARAAVGMHDNGLDIIVEVTDTSHFKNLLPAKLLEGDNIRIAIDCERNGMAGGNTEIEASLTAKGPVAWKILASDPRGDIPSRWSPANGEAKYVNQTITREASLTRYQLRIPWSELYPLVYDTTKSLRLSILIKNNNQSGKVEYLEWGAGMGSAKDPSKYGSLDVKQALK
jgi:hypothetical protein